MTGLRRAIITCARSCAGTPFHHQGRAKGVGMDCVGLVAHVVAALGLAEVPDANHARQPSGDRLLEALRGLCAEVPAAGILPGDVVCFWVEPRSRVPQHVGIVCEDGASMVHAHAGSKRVVEVPLGRWASRIVCGFRLPGVEATWQP